MVDLNPNKQGRFLPGTGHRIMSPAELASAYIRTVVLMNPNYRDENMRIVERLGLEIDWL